MSPCRKCSLRSTLDAFSGPFRLRRKLIAAPLPRLMDETTGPKPRSPSSWYCMESHECQVHRGSATAGTYIHLVALHCVATSGQKQGQFRAGLTVSHRQDFVESSLEGGVHDHFARYLVQMIAGEADSVACHERARVNVHREVVWFSGVETELLGQELPRD